MFSMNLKSQVSYTPPLIGSSLTLICALQGIGELHCRVRLSSSDHVVVWNALSNTFTLNKNRNRLPMAYHLHTGQQVAT